MGWRRRGSRRFHYAPPTSHYSLSTLPHYPLLLSSFSPLPHAREEHRVLDLDESRAGRLRVVLVVSSSTDAYSVASARTLDVGARVENRLQRLAAAMPHGVGGWPHAGHGHGEQVHPQRIETVLREERRQLRSDGRIGGVVTCLRDRREQARAELVRAAARRGSRCTSSGRRCQAPRPRPARPAASRARTPRPVARRRVRAAARPRRTSNRTRRRRMAVPRHPPRRP